MASDLQLLRVVAFDGDGKPVVVPLAKWKLSYSERRASLEVKCTGYSKTYDLHTDLASVAPVESRQKFSLGKTLGRVALTGLVHGRHGAAADLRWGGVDRDEVMTLMLFFRDTTTVQVELGSDEVEALLEMVPETVASDEAYEAAKAIVSKVNAMADDGPRVLAELDAMTEKVQQELIALRPNIESGESFDERRAARERCATLERELANTQPTRTAVLYTLAYQGKDVGTWLGKPATAPAVASPESLAVAAAATPLASVSAAPAARANNASSLSSVVRPALRKSGASTLVKILVFLLGAFVGCVAALISMVFYGHWGLILSPVTVIGAGWLAVKMLNNLMRR